MLWEYFISLFKRHHGRGSGISIIIPYRKSKHISRQTENFNWLKKYWKCHLPGAEIIIGKDNSHHPFSKAAAVNNGVGKSHGDILVIVDCDGYVDFETVLHCANKIRKARRRDHRLWYVPYRQFYRLTHQASRRVLNSEPSHPETFPSPPNRCDIQNTSGSGHGHWFGALIQIMPREAFNMIGGWDGRFRGWGGEDHSMMRAVDTLYWPHKTLPGQVLHLWHPGLSKEGTGYWIEWSKRIWDDQPNPGTNSDLAMRYSRAHNDVDRMQRLVDEYEDYRD